MNTNVVSVTLLATYLKQLLETDDILSDIWVEGEVTRAFQAASGHVYFTLGEQQATLKCVLFRANAIRQQQLPREGDSVVVHGRVGVYDRDTTVQLYADVVQPAGLGIQALELERLRLQLESEGLFDPSRKRPLPDRPKVIGVVTSADGAVWHDIQHVLRRRYPLVEVILAPSSVQGDDAPARLVSAISAIQSHPGVEVIIIGRGGGSPEDLAAFNTEAVARSVFACSVPVVSAVGHETDWTIIDFVADARAPTPSAAAELCVPSVADLRDSIDAQQRQLSATISRAVNDARLAMLTRRERFARVEAPKRPGVCRERVLQYRARLDSAYTELLSEKRQGSQGLGSLLEALNPRRILERGYAAVTDGATDIPITRAREARERPSLRMQFHDDSVLARPFRRADSGGTASGDAA